MTDPIFWLGLSVGLVAAGLFAVVITLVPAVIQLGRAAKSVERFFDTLLRELPPTLEALRLTSLEVSEIADSVDDGVKGAGQVAKQVGRSVSGAQSQAQGAQVNAQSLWAGVQAGWQTFVKTSTTKQLSAGSRSGSPQLTQPQVPPSLPTDLTSRPSPSPARPSRPDQDS